MTVQTFSCRILVGIAMASEGFITESQRHFGINDGLVGDDELGLAAVFDFREIGKVEAHLFTFLGYQHIEVFDVLRRFQEKRTTQFSLQQLTGGLQQAGSWSDGIARKMGLIDQVVGIAAQIGCEAVFIVFYRLKDKEFVQEMHRDFVYEEAKIKIFPFNGKSPI